MKKRRPIRHNVCVSASACWNLLKTEPASFPVTTFNSSGTKHTLLDSVLNNTEIRPKKPHYLLISKIPSPVKQTVLKINSINTGIETFH